MASSMVDVLYEASGKLSDAEVYDLIRLMERRFDKPDPVTAIAHAMAALSLEELFSLRAAMVGLLGPDGKGLAEAPASRIPTWPILPPGERNI